VFLFFLCFFFGWVWGWLGFFFFFVGSFFFLFGWFWCFFCDGPMKGLLETVPLVCLDLALVFSLVFSITISNTPAFPRMVRENHASCFLSTPLSSPLRHPPLPLASNNFFDLPCRFAALFFLEQAVTDGIVFFPFSLPYPSN